MTSSFHGAYKTPGGKLVAVDLTVAGERIQDAVVHGDFFLHPDESLTAISQSLEGLRRDATREEISRAISAAIPAGTEWLGSSADALAIAVRHAFDEGGDQTP